MDEVTLNKLVDAIEDTIYTRFGPFDFHDLNILMLEIIRELTNRWYDKKEVS
jgi:hypothetical protein